MRIETRAVLAGARVSRKGDNLTHAVRVDTGLPLCRVKAESIADRFATDVHARPTCPTCASKDPRGKSAGPFALASRLQIGGEGASNA